MDYAIMVGEIPISTKFFVKLSPKLDICMEPPSALLPRTKYRIASVYQNTPY